MERKKLAIIGKGAWGTALGSAFSSHEVEYVYRNESLLDNVSYILESDYVLIAVPAQANRDIFTLIQSYVKQEQPIILCSKGFEILTGKFLSEVAREYFPKNDILFLAGPNFSDEILDGLPAIATLACENKELAAEVAENLSTDTFKLYPTEDIVSSEIFAALKNVIAIACGISMGLNLGENFKSAVITNMISEALDLIRDLGGSVESIISPAGIGDIILTSTSEKSRNTSFGKLLVNKPPKKFLEENTVEGYFTLDSIMKISSEVGISLPIVSYLYKVCYQRKTVKRTEFIRTISTRNG
ncbi:MAG: hypothetical protein RLN62_05310 [Rickettsiales bacterium]